MREVIGILPSSGSALRLRPFKYPKQLLPIAFTKPDKEGNSRPILVAEYSTRVMRFAGIKKCFITTNDSSVEILRYFGDGSSFGIQISYLYQEEPRGVPQAIDLAYEWVKDKLVCLAWPDTVYKPFSAIKDIYLELEKSQADLILGAFPNSNPNQSFPVYYDQNGNVYKVAYKPKRTGFKNTCGLAIWNPNFSIFLHNHLLPKTSKTEQQIMDIFGEAIKEGLKVKCLFFKNGTYTDLGNPSGIGDFILDNYDKIINL